MRQQRCGRGEHSGDEANKDSGDPTLELFILISERRRSKGKACWCLKPHELDDGRRRSLIKAEHRQGIVQLVTWFTLVHDAFQITIASVATASQVASAGSPRSAMFINAIEVSALVFVKLFNLLTWGDTWTEQGTSEKLKRRAARAARVARAAKVRVTAVVGRLSRKSHRHSREDYPTMSSAKADAV